MSKRKNSDSSSDDSDGKIIIRLWPKTPVLYPMAILALVCGIVGQIFGVPEELKGNTNAAPQPAVVETPAELPAPPSADPIEAPPTTTEPESNATEPTPSAESEPKLTPAPAPTPDPVPAPSPAPAPAADSDPAPAPSANEVIAPLAFSKEVDKSKSGLINTILAVVFLIMSAFSLFVVCIDFEVRWSLLVFVLFMMVFMGTLVADKMGYITLPEGLSVFDNFTLYATPLFYYCVFGIWILLMLVSALIARLHYVKIEHNEVVVVSGVLESQKRMSTMRMHYTKEIQDVFEYYLPFVRSGRLIFTFPNEDQPLIMDNVIGINRVLKKLDKKSSAFQVTTSAD